MEILSGRDAWLVLDDSSFVDAWRNLSDACPFGTAYQSPDFGLPWYRTYRETYEPVLVFDRIENGQLRGLLCLARTVDSGAIVVLGDHQSEYHGWLLGDGADPLFVAKALGLAVETFGQFDLIFTWLYPETDTSAFDLDPALAKRTTVIERQCPVQNLDADDIAKSFKKKSNKSRLNRLRKQGEFEFKKIETADEFSQVLHATIPFYDVRQGAVNGVMPFSNDPLKRAFYEASFREAPASLHVTAIMIDANPVSLHIGTISDKTVHVSILAYAPHLSHLSLGKLHLMLLARGLLESGFDRLDLTPGGDPWKERFANAHAQIKQLRLHRTATEKTIASLRAHILDGSKRTLNAAKIQPSDVRRVVASIAQMKERATAHLRPATADAPGLKRAIFALATDRPATQTNPTIFIAQNDMATLTRFANARSSKERQPFLRQALSLLEAGANFMSARDVDDVTWFAWMMPLKQSAIAPSEASWADGREEHTLIDLNVVGPASAIAPAVLEGLAQLMPDEGPLLLSLPAAAAPDRTVLDEVGWKHIAEIP